MAEFPERWTNGVRLDTHPEGVTAWVNDPHDSAKLHAALRECFEARLGVEKPEPLSDLFAYDGDWESGGRGGIPGPNPYSDDEPPAAAAPAATASADGGKGARGGLRFGPRPGDEQPAAEERAAPYSADGSQGARGRGKRPRCGISDDELPAAAARAAPGSADDAQGAHSGDDEVGGAGIAGERKITRKQLRGIAAAFADAPLEEIESKLATWQEALNAGEKRVVTVRAVRKLIDKFPDCAMQLPGFAAAEDICAARARLCGDKPQQVVKALADEVETLRRTIDEAHEDAWGPLGHGDEA